MIAISLKKGFTLVELIISVTIFSILMAIGVGSYLNLSVTLKKQNIQRKLYSEMTHVLEDIHRWGKYYTIDYNAYESTEKSGEGVEKLVLISKDGFSKIHIQKMESSTDKKFTLGIYKEQKGEVGYIPEQGFILNTPQSLISKNIHIQDCRFFISPFLQTQTSFQPKVTIILQGSIFNPFTAKDDPFHLQTTFSIRSYLPTYDSPSL